MNIGKHMCVHVCVCVCVCDIHKYARHNDVSVNDGPHTRQWSHKIIWKRKEQRLEAAQIKFLRHLLGITKLDKEKNQFIGRKNGNTEHSKRNKTVPGKVATTHTEDGHK